MATIAELRSQIVALQARIEAAKAALE